MAQYQVQAESACQQVTQTVRRPKSKHMENQSNSEHFQQLWEVFINPDVQRCIHAIDQIVGYRLPESARRSFLSFHKFVTTDPPPVFIIQWRTNKKLEYWYHKHINGILGSTQNALACAYYHRDNLIEIEKQVLDELQNHNYKKALGNSTLGLGNTLRWDFEYQAFILAVRRCLDYLVRALAAFFKNDFHSYHRFSVFLKSQKPEIVAEKLCEVHSSYLAKFSFVTSEGSNKSIRDRISHYEYVPVGTINLSSRGFLLAGGGEELKPSSSGQFELLSEIIDQHLMDLQDCIDTYITCYINAVNEFYKRQGA
ncbi:MAG: hypothetical protein M1281_01705 [Chloroflexi bacterium]|nr:hypothetical protein [Chloroflexota bacterium]